MESKIENPFLTNQQQMLLLKMGLYLGVDVLFTILGITYLSSLETILSQYVPLMLLAYISLFTVMAIWIKKNNTNSMILYVVLLFLLLAGLYAFAVTWWIISSVLLCLHWRITSYFQSEDDQIEIGSGVLLVFLFLSALSLIIGNARDLENKFLVIGLVLVLFSLVATVTSYQRMMNGGRESETESKRHLIKPLFILLIIIASGGVLASFSSYVRSAFYWMIGKIFWMFSFLINPIFDFLVKIRDWIMSLISKETLSGMGLKLNNQEIDETQQQAFYEGLSLPWLNELLIGIFLLAAIIYLVKKRKVTYGVDSNQVSSSLLSKSKNGKKTGKSRPDTKIYSDAENAIRQEMRELEREAAAADKGRGKNEGIRNWFSKLGIQEEENFFQLYESVRYGTKIPSKQEVTLFRKRVRLHISHLKDQENKS
ncbi:hypothetical protein HP456_02015 [Bacillus haikouensis]|uniref:hypothetical protein n=1 Tax=Bacillus haikouensis TaxID=1510468 RepID=UPI0015535D77|nr:hypothetical protein [Bacillus haikouensis]NQD64700.1 hypothetical protein [Bacillus haikouensis]